MTFIVLRKFEFVNPLRHWLRCWFKRWQGRAPQAALMAPPVENSVPPPQPELNTTPQDWLDKQPPENAILVYISMPSHQIVELRSLPRHSLDACVGIPMYRNPDAKWAQANSRCLRRIDFCSSTEFVAHLMAMEALEFLQCARGLLSAELANLDLLISTLFAEICPDLADDAQLETSNANNAGTTETYNAHEAAENLAMRVAKSETSQADIPQFVARLCITIAHARSHIKPTNKRQMLAALLNERKFVSGEMAQLDAKVLPELRKLGLSQNVE